MTEPMLDDRYRLIAPLAEGGMSVVWHGHDEVLARSVAVKVIKTEAGPSTKFAQRVRREATALARLSHRHIANVYDYGECDLDGVPAPYLVMELVDGESLGAMLRRGPVSPPTAVGIAAQVAGALAAAHAAGVVHCDVTPGNVMLCADGVKIIDFGIASIVGDIAEGVVFGTPAYLAPERRNGGRAIPASDVYGIGLLLYEMLAGRLPWPDGTATEVVAAHRTIPPAPLPDVPGLPEPVAGLCAACLDVDPARRPMSREVWRCLNGIVRASDPRSRRTLSEVTAKIRSSVTARSPTAAAVPPGSADVLAPAAAFASGLPIGSGRPITSSAAGGAGAAVGSGTPFGSGVPLGSGTPLGSGAALGSGSRLGSGTPNGVLIAPPVGPGVLPMDTVASQDAAGPSAFGSAQAGRSRSGTRIMPHGVTALPDPGRATEPIEEPPPSWRRRSRRPFFALPSLLLLVLLVCLGLSELRANGGAAAGSVPNQPARPGFIAAPPATPSVTPTDGPTSARNGAGTAHGPNIRHGHNNGDGYDSDKGPGHGQGGGNHARTHAGSHAGKGAVAAPDPAAPNAEAPDPAAPNAEAPDPAAPNVEAPDTVAPDAAASDVAEPGAAAAVCRVDYQIVTQRLAGFTAQMTVTNAGPAQISGWTLRFRLTGGQQVAGGLNGEWEQHGSEVSVRDAGFNHVVPPDGTVTLGFVGGLTRGDAHEPSDFTLNGTPCYG